MPRKTVSPKSKSSGRRVHKDHSQHGELRNIFRDLIFITLGITGIALIAAAFGIDSHDFWEIIRYALSLQGVWQGTRLLSALSKER